MRSDWVCLGRVGPSERWFRDSVRAVFEAAGVDDPMARLRILAESGAVLGARIDDELRVTLAAVTLDGEREVTARVLRYLIDHHGLVQVDSDVVLRALGD
jgi:hypothetical protein